jgi:hypothetical protein
MRRQNVERLAGTIWGTRWPVPFRWNDAKNEIQKSNLTYSNIKQITGTKTRNDGAEGAPSFRSTLNMGGSRGVMEERNG